MSKFSANEELRQYLEDAFYKALLALGERAKDLDWFAGNTPTPSSQRYTWTPPEYMVGDALLFQMHLPPVRRM